MVFSRQEYWSGLPFLSPVDHILSDLSTMTHPSWVTHRAWLSFIELDKAVVQVVRLASFLWLWFQCVCPLIPSRNTYCLTWVSLTLDIGYLFTAAPAKCSRCSLPWTRGISSPPPVLTLNLICITVVCARATSAVWAVTERLPTARVLWIENLTLPRIGLCILLWLFWSFPVAARQLSHAHMYSQSTLGLGQWPCTPVASRENSNESFAGGAELSMRHQRTVWLTIQTMKKDRLDFDFLLCEIWSGMFSLSKTVPSALLPFL